MARRMRQRHKSLPAPAFGDPDIVLHNRVAASKTVLCLETFENPLGRVALLFAVWRKSKASRGAQGENALRNRRAM